ncbi:MAG: hypothetical protein B7X10_00615 [Burkholderiales bacterium 21-58-4]|nr:MAG: hypothetical protein B7X10_00615 [Burkholderiales bacterium 21-58-4]
MALFQRLSLCGFGRLDEFLFHHKPIGQFLPRIGARLTADRPLIRIASARGMKFFLGFFLEILALPLHHLPLVRVGSI